MRSDIGSETMMQQYASGRSSGQRAHSSARYIDHVVARVTAPSECLARTVAIVLCRAPMNGLLSRCSRRCAQRDAFGDLASGRHAPECNEQFTRQRHDHGLACVAASVNRSRAKPLGQGAVLLESEEAPCELDHAPAHPRVTGSGKAPLTPTLATFIGRPGEARVACNRSAIA